MKFLAFLLAFLPAIALADATKEGMLITPSWFCSTEAQIKDIITSKTNAETYKILYSGGCFINSSETSGVVTKFYVTKFDSKMGIYVDVYSITMMSGETVYVGVKADGDAS